MSYVVDLFPYMLGTCSSLLCRRTALTAAEADSKHGLLARHRSGPCGGCARFVPSAWIRHSSWLNVGTVGPRCTWLLHGRFAVIASACHASHGHCPKFSSRYTHAGSHRACHHHCCPQALNKKIQSPPKAWWSPARKDQRLTRKGKNPSTGAALKTTASTAPKFVAGAKFKAAVSQSDKAQRRQGCKTAAAVASCLYSQLTVKA